MRPCRPPLRLSALRSREPRSASAPHTIAPTISTIIATIKIVIARPISTPGPYLPGLRAKPASSPGASPRAGRYAGPELPRCAGFGNGPCNDDLDGRDDGAD